jgi:hypothetical protein
MLQACVCPSSCVVATFTTQFTTQFTCFTSTKVQILTQQSALQVFVSVLKCGGYVAGMLFTAHFTCFTSTKVQILTQQSALVALQASRNTCVRCGMCWTFSVWPRFSLAFLGDTLASNKGILTE